jgi:hypothetical protein
VQSKRVAFWNTVIKCCLWMFCLTVTNFSKICEHQFGHTVTGIALCSTEANLLAGYFPALCQKFTERLQVERRQLQSCLLIGRSGAELRNPMSSCKLVQQILRNKFSSRLKSGLPPSAVDHTTINLVSSSVCPAYETYSSLKFTYRLRPAL